MIPEAVLAQIQDRVDIVETIQGYVPLRRAGHSFKGCCPFHQEKTPSFYVHAEKQIFHCFGCGVGGNVFSFLMKIQKREFLDVVEELAERVGVELPKASSLTPKEVERYALFYKANELAAEFYHDFLLKRAESETARAYLKRRGLSAETIRDFKIGYSPDTWDALYAKLKGAIPEAILERAGLTLPKRDGGFYDRFRKRIIFPIVDLKGRTVALGGRVLDDSVPKYLNSPESEIYFKSRNLYGLYQARQAIRDADAVIVVEGYMDTVACHQAGVRNVVASLGTSLTQDQARLIKRHTKNVIILYDADAAGESATLRGLEVFLSEGVEVKILRLEGGHDPDEYIQKHGAETFRKQLAEAQSIFDYRLALLKETFDSRTVEGRVKIANEMAGLLGKVQNEILRAAWAKELGEELGIPDEALRAEIAKLKDGARLSASFAKATDRPKAESSVPATFPLAEKILLGLMLADLRFVQRSRQELVLEDFTNPHSRRLAEIVFGSPGELMPAARLMNLFPQDAEFGNFLSALVDETEKLSDREKAFEDCLGKLQEARASVTRQKLLSQIAEAAKTGDQTRIQKFMSDLNELNKKGKTHEKK